MIDIANEEQRGSVGP